MTGGSIPNLTHVKGTSAKELHARAIYDPFRTTSVVVGYQQRIRGGAFWLLMGPQAADSKIILPLLIHDPYH